MKIQRMLAAIGGCFWLALFGLSAAQPSPGTMVRAAYLRLTSLEQGAAHLEQLRQAGVNTALVADKSYQIDEALWQGWRSLAEQQGISVLAVINFAVPAELRNTPGRYRPYVNRNGQIYARTPCPLDYTYWEQVIARRFEEFSALAGTTGLVGAAFDTEMYGSDISLYTDLCVCDACWQEFWESLAGGARLTPGERQSAGALPPAQRFAYLTEHDLLEPYTTLAWQRLQQILRPMVQRLHQIQPTFQIGFLGYRYSWFYAALVQGLGTPELPALVFSESSYVLGYTPYVDRERDQIQAPGNYARYIPGLWLHRYFPPDVATQLTDLALHTDGYWIYTADSLWQDDQPKKKNPLHGDRFAYWMALQQANYELVRLSYNAAGGRTIAPVRPSSFYDRARQRLRTTPELHAIFRDLVDLAGVANRSGLNATYRGDTLLHCRIPRGGSIRLIHEPIGDEHTMVPLIYTLFDDVGDLLQTGQVTPEQPASLAPFQGKLHEWVSLLIESGAHGVQVELAQGAACVFEASSTFPLEIYQTEQSYQFAVVPGAIRLPFRAYCRPQQAAVLTVRAPDQSVSQTIEITDEFTEFQVELSSPAAQSFGRINAAPVPDAVFGNVRWFLYDYAYPYVIPGRD